MNSAFTGRDIPSDELIGRCVRCGLCLPHCPTYLETFKETSSPRGRIHLIEAVSKGHLSLTDRGFVEQMYQCLDCRACEAVCPSGVAYGKLVESARTQIERTPQISPLKRVVRWLILHQLFGKMWLFRLVSACLRLYQRSGFQWLLRKTGILRLLQIEKIEQLLPLFPSSFIVPGDQHYTPEQTTSTSQKVALFTGCIMSTAFAETDRATSRILLAAGHTVDIPAQQGCCGALTVHAGAMDEARLMARRNIEAFEEGKSEYIVCNAAGCGSMLKEYTHLLKDDPLYAERAQKFSTKVRDICEFLVNYPLQKPLPPVQLKVTYQEPCHLVHAQRISQEPRKLLRSIPGLELIEMHESDLCCGSAGIYNITQPAMSQRLQERKIKHILETGADLVVTANPGCYLQLQRGLMQAGSSMRVIHLVDLLDQTLREIHQSH